MLRTILVAVDSSPQHTAILDQVAELAIASGAKVHVVSVADFSGTGSGLEQSCAGMVSFLVEEVDEILHSACKRLSDQGVPCRTHALNGIVSEQIITLANEVHANMIVVGHRHLNWMQRIFENSVGRDLLEYAPCNILVVRDNADAV